MSSHHVTGEVREGGAPVSRSVRVYDQATGELLANGTSNPNNGHYDVPLASADPVFVFVRAEPGWLSEMRGPIVPLEALPDAITFEAVENHYESSSSASSHTVSIPAAAQAGDLILCVVVVGTGSETITSGPDGFTLAAEYQPDPRIAVYYKGADGSDAGRAITTTITPQSRIETTLMVLRGGAIQAPSATLHASTEDHSALPGPTLSTDGGEILALYVEKGDFTEPVPAGWEELRAGGVRGIDTQILRYQNSAAGANGPLTFESNPRRDLVLVGVDTLAGAA